MNLEALIIGVPTERSTLQLTERVADLSRVCITAFGIHLPGKRFGRALERVGGFTYTPEERSFAERLQKSTAFTVVPLETTARVKPLVIDSTGAGALGGGSTDVGDVSWVVPTVQLSAATWVPGTAAHSWQAVAAGGMSIGAKGMMVAAKTMALTGADLFSSPATLEVAKAELTRKRGANFRYSTALGSQQPQLDYRKGSVP